MRKEAEPPSINPSSTSNLFYVGRNSRGAWVVQDQSGLHGGLFIDRAEALRFALFENGHRPQAVPMVPGALELDLSRVATPLEPQGADAASLTRKAA